MQKKELVQQDPMLRAHKKEAEKFFDTIMAYAPALVKAKFVVRNLIKNWISSGQDYVTHPQLEQLIKLQKEYTQSRPGHSEISGAIKNLSHPIMEATRITGKNEGK